MHPLIERADDKRVRQVKEFRQAAADLSGGELAKLYEQERAAAPKRREAGLALLGQHPKKPPSARRSGRDEEHLGMALLAKQGEAGDFLELPEGGGLTLVDHSIPLATAKADKERGNADPNYGVGKLDLLAFGPEERMVVFALKYVEPEGTRTGTGETPLRLLLQGLAHTAIAEANREALSEEAVLTSERRFSEEPPLLLLAASPRYWKLCRKREAQKGAAWIREIERLATEFEEASGIGVRFTSLHVRGDPGWDYGEGGPTLSGAADLERAWERSAGQPKPKPRSRSRRTAQVEDEIVEPDMTRPVRNYGINESYAPGDRIEHPTLGLGVVQGSAGPGKIRVHFGEKKSLLVHERAGGAARAATAGAHEESRP